ncbi:hypothetical protein DFJ58DRAFT_294284 [Suillus subalutaceus]|uniref:uncharacterized protein n=1 Tax=Suillus subalutaceus TaxID=48586 RepID=UPI001B86BBD2|nr:uncharacterized protein DFJ58DRAFT_294284 [Suillus subalutaceus]KAG1829016.1 hypothetical protein DFJ58DRAFT_294284 [Suillus subalutaceus]
MLVRLMTGLADPGSRHVQVLLEFEVTFRTVLNSNLGKLVGFAKVCAHCIYDCFCDDIKTTDVVVVDPLDITAMASKSTTGLPLDSANIMSTVLEGILYGFSVLMFIGTIWTFTYKQRIRDINRPIAVVAILLFVLSTAHMIVGIVRLEDELVKYGNTFHDGPAGFFADVTQQTFLIKNTIITLQTLLGDGVVIYRCYFVWQSVWIIILPCMMWCGVAAFGICMVYVQAPTTNAKNVFGNKTGHWITAFLSLTLATNLLSSELLAYRIWTIECNVSGAYATKNKMPILRVLVDAALIYSAALCASQQEHPGMPLGYCLRREKTSRTEECH